MSNGDIALLIIEIIAGLGAAIVIAIILACLWVKATWGTDE